MNIFRNTLPKMTALAVAATLSLFTGMAQAEDLQPLVTGNTAFALDLYSRLKSGEGNLFFSPYSISTCLAMTYAGARGDTEKQMAQVLHFGNNQGQLPQLFGALQNQLNEAQKKQEIQLNVANGLWAQEGHPFLSAFLKIARQQYEANLNQADFHANADSVGSEINDWVSAKTKGKITNLIPAGMLSAMTRLVLVNAIYFKGHWATQFKKSNTADAPFSVTSEHKVQVPLMNITEDYKYAEPEGLQVLELPYVGKDVSMVVLLPREIDGLKQLEDSLTGAKLSDWLAQLRSQKVDVFLPKFKLTSQFGLADTLASMGMPAPFSPQADFSGMDGTHDLFISAVVHKAYVDVNEEGTEAAAATGVVATARAVRRPEPIPVFRADHPFIFLIRDTHSGRYFFWGGWLSRRNEYTKNGCVKYGGEVWNVSFAENLGLTGTGRHDTKSHTLPGKDLMNPMWYLLNRICKNQASLRNIFVRAGITLALLNFAEAMAKEPFPSFVAEGTFLAELFKSDSTNALSKGEGNFSFHYSNGWWQVEARYLNPDKGMPAVGNCMQIPDGTRHYTLFQGNADTGTTMAFARPNAFPPAGRIGMFLPWLSLCPNPKLPLINDRLMRRFLTIPDTISEPFNDPRNEGAFAIKFLAPEKAFVSELIISNNGFNIDVAVNKEGYVESDIHAFAAPFDNGFLEMTYQVLETTNLNGITFPLRAVYKRFYPDGDPSKYSSTLFCSKSAELIVKRIRFPDGRSDEQKPTPQKLFAADNRPTGFPRERNVSYVVTNDLWKPVSDPEIRHYVEMAREEK